LLLGAGSAEEHRLLESWAAEDARGAAPGQATDAAWGSAVRCWLGGDAQATVLALLGAQSGSLGGGACALPALRLLLPSADLSGHALGDLVEALRRLCNAGAADLASNGLHPLALGPAALAAQCAAEREGLAAASGTTGPCSSIWHLQRRARLEWLCAVAIAGCGAAGDPELDESQARQLQQQGVDIDLPSMLHMLRCLRRRGSTDGRPSRAGAGARLVRWHSGETQFSELSALSMQSTGRRSVDRGPPRQGSVLGEG
jgi:hypothetical protein